MSKDGHERRRHAVKAYLKESFLKSAGARPIVSPPWIWPSTIIGLMMFPQSSTATKRRTLTSPVPRSMSTTQM